MKRKTLEQCQIVMPSHITIDRESYVNFHTKCKMTDSEYGEFVSIPYTVFKSRIGHPMRANKAKSDSKKLSIEEVRSRLPSHLTVDETTFTGVLNKALFIDNKYGEFWARPNSIFNGGASHKMRGSLNKSLAYRKPLSEVLPDVPAHVRLDESTYEGLNKKAKFIDELYGEWWAVVYNVLNGSNHPTRSKKIQAEKYKKIARERGLANILPNGKNVTEYCAEKGISGSASNANQIFRIHGADFTETWIDNHDAYISRLEQAFEQEVRKILPGDIEMVRYNKGAGVLRLSGWPYRPDFRFRYNGKIVYVDVDGLKIHSDDMESDDRYHLNKAKAYKDKGIVLLQFRQDEVAYKLPIIVSMILSRLGVTEQKLMARKTVVKPVTSSEAEIFLTMNHLMGYYQASKHVGLYNGEDLVSLMSYRVYGNYVDVARFASKMRYSVAGGLSKLMYHVATAVGKRTVKSCVDLRYADGNSLAKLGFKLISVELGFQWTDGISKTYNRQHCMANMDDRGLSQEEHAAELKLYKIYDAGQATYSLNDIS
jgi:hypothetical protein